MNSLRVLSVVLVVILNFAHVYAVLSAHGISGNVGQGLIFDSLAGIAGMTGIILTFTAPREYNYRMKNIACMILPVLFSADIYNALGPGRL